MSTANTIIAPTNKLKERNTPHLRVTETCDYRRFCFTDLAFVLGFAVVAFAAFQTFNPLHF